MAILAGSAGEISFFGRKHVGGFRESRFGRSRAYLGSGRMRKKLMRVTVMTQFDAFDMGVQASPIGPCRLFLKKIHLLTVKIERLLLLGLELSLFPALSKLTCRVGM